MEARVIEIANIVNLGLRLLAHTLYLWPDLFYHFAYYHTNWLITKSKVTD
ncbi:hypothetical protein BDD43_1099 [Mucilaginibacter gracilis]|uniref:Uncharacterized protein n=1 Tax=Mucilaginibacter gracilis TaxID=423350 RepID=A0A495IX52_9SPHI|nr:hypothetical protein BDD43_1099 [Mucilaginibacter gracilis]